MQARVSFFVRGANPYQALKSLVRGNGILQNSGGLLPSVVEQRELSGGLHLVQVASHDLQLLQMQQGIPFRGFLGKCRFDPWDLAEVLYYRIIGVHNW